MSPSTGAVVPAIVRSHLAVEGGDLPLTVARGGGRGPAVVLLPSAFGVAADLEIQMLELAADASLVVAFDPFFRDDPGPAPYDGMARVMARLRALDSERAYRDLRATIDWARGQRGSPSVVLVGLCFGGPYTLRAAADGVVDGAVIWHGTRLEQHLDRAAEVRCPVRMHFGGADPFVPPAAVEAVRLAFQGSPNVRMTVHEGATHGFSHRAAPAAYNAPAEQAGMESVRELLREATLAGLAGERR